MLDTWDWRHHPSIHPLLGSGRRGPFLPPLIRYVDPADFLSRDHCLLSINKRPLFSSDHWISLSERVGEEGSFLGQVTTNTAQKEKEDEKRTVRSWMDGWAMCINGSEREREGGREGDARTAFGNGGERGARRLKHSSRRASLFDAQG